MEVFVILTLETFHIWYFNLLDFLFVSQLEMGNKSKSEMLMIPLMFQQIVLMPCESSLGQGVMWILSFSHLMFSQSDQHVKKKCI